MCELRLEGRVRKSILQAALKSGRVGAHIAPSLSLVEICIGIIEAYRPDRDVFVLSKAHGALGYYSVMHQLGLLLTEQFETFEQNGGEFPGQPSRSNDNGIDYSGGSLGMGLSYAAGRAWASRDTKVFVVLGDGELDEGSNWEAASIISKQNISNVCVVVDCNGLQSDGRCGDILNNNLKRLWKAHGWKVLGCNGHDADAIKSVIVQNEWERPLVILAQTTKGKGVSYMEDNNEWHHHQLSEEQFKLAVVEIEEKYGL